MKILSNDQEQNNNKGNWNFGAVGIREHGFVVRRRFGIWTFD